MSETGRKDGGLGRDGKRENIVKSWGRMRGKDESTKLRRKGKRGKR